MQIIMEFLVSAAKAIYRWKFNLHWQSLLSRGKRVILQG